MNLFAELLGDAFDALPPAVRRVHGAANEATFQGSGRARGSRNPLIRLGRTIIGIPQPGRYPTLVVTVSPDPSGETWTRRFGSGRFGSRLRPAGPGRFEEHFGPVRFVFTVHPNPTGMTWRFIAWRLGRLPLPLAWAPRLRARIDETDGGYRFFALAAHPWVGVLFAYAGRLD